MIKVENINKSFGTVKAVVDLSFEVQKGEVVGLLGPNGAGKTTTMRLITGYLMPDSGSIEVGGVSTDTNILEVQKKIGYMPENNPLYKDMLVNEVLSFSADLKGIPKDKRKDSFDFVVNAMSLNDVFYRTVGELSKGYKQRVGIAVALLQKPEVLILDEPTEGLDPNQRNDIRSLIKDFAKDHTVIMSTHVMQEAQAVCDRMIIIAGGALIADGSADDLSKLAEHESVLEMVVGGKNIDMALKNLVGAEHVDIKHLPDGKVAVTIMSKESMLLQPEISRLIGEKGWTIWKLAEKEHKLEDVFHKLTSEL